MEVTWIKKKHTKKPPLELYVCHQKLGIRVEINTKQNKDKKGTGYWPNDFIYHPKIQLVHP